MNGIKSRGSRDDKDDGGGRGAEIAGRVDGTGKGERAEIEGGQ